MDFHFPFVGAAKTDYPNAAFNRRKAQNMQAYRIYLNPQRYRRR